MQSTWCYSFIFVSSVRTALSAKSTDGRNRRHRPGCGHDSATDQCSRPAGAHHHEHAGVGCHDFISFLTTTAAAAATTTPTAATTTTAAPTAATTKTPSGCCHFILFWIVPATAAAAATATAARCHCDDSPVKSFSSHSVGWFQRDGAAGVLAATPVVVDQQRRVGLSHLRPAL